MDEALNKRIQAEMKQPFITAEVKFNTSLDPDARTAHAAEYIAFQLGRIATSLETIAAEFMHRDRD